MYEFHGWFCLSDSTSESDTAINPLNGQYCLTVTGNTNRRTDESLADLIELVRQRLPGSWGLLYERDDNLTEPPGPNLYQVTVLARGTLVKRLDPFLSPCNPTIED